MKPILMNPSETLTQMLASQSNGLGRLNAQRCVVTEERNGMYEAELTVFIDDEHFSSLSVGSVLKLMTNEGLQMFRVYQITKPINGVCTVYAHHITYDLAKAPVLPFTATGASSVVDGLVSHLASTYEFGIETDIVNTQSTFTLTEPKYFRECLGGYQGSVLDVFGGEYEWDNLTVRLLAHRGSDNGVQIRYGKNLTDIQQETNIESMYDAVIGYATVDETTTTGTVQMITQVSSPKTMLVDFSDQFESGDTVTVEELNTLAQNYIQSHDLSTPKVSIDVSFIALASTDQYKDIAPLEHVKLCDTVHVLFEKLGVNASAKVIKTEYDSLNERLLSVEIGDAKSNLNSVIDSTVADANASQTRAVNAVDGAVANLTNMILNSLGLFVSKVEKSGGGYQYYMHNRPELSDSQYQWTINAGGFAVSQDYGQTWTAGIDADGNAVFNSIAANVINAMEINGGKISAPEISGGEISSPKLFFNVNESPAVLGSGKYTMYDFADGETKIVYGPFIRDVNDGYTTGLILRGGFALASTLYPSYIGTENNHRLLLWFGSPQRKIDNRTPEQSSTAGLYIANETGEDKCYIALRDDGIVQESSDVSVQLMSGTNGVNIDKTNGVNIHGTSVTVNGYNVITCGSNKITCQTAIDTSGHTILNFFLNGSYVGHTVY